MASEKRANRSAYMAFLTGAATADCEADLDELLRVFNPVSSRDEMGEIFESTLGYNPITHYDMQDILAAIDLALESMSASGKERVESERDRISKRAQIIYEDNRLRHINEAVVSALADVLNSEDANAVSIALTGVSIPILDADDDDDEDGIGAGVDDEEDDDLSVDDLEEPLLGGEDDDDGPLFEEDDDEE